MIHFGKWGNLNPRYIGPFESLDRIGHVAYRLRLPQELIKVHDIFDVSNLKRCFSGETNLIPLNEIQLNTKLHFVEEPVEIIDWEVTCLKQSRIPIVKVRWNSQRGPEFTWECEDQMKRKYAQLFSDVSSTS